VTIRKKLIEVSIPLEAINAASAREKSIPHGHPSTLHLWWARRPLAARRAVLFAQPVDEPSAWPEQFEGEDAQEVERKRLHAIIGELVKWENPNNEIVLNAARWEIARSVAWGLGEEPPARKTAQRSSPNCKRRRHRSTTRSAAVARSPWRRSAWDCGPTART
jgi:putative DNA methylase